MGRLKNLRPSQLLPILRHYGVDAEEDLGVDVEEWEVAG